MTVMLHVGLAKTGTSWLQQNVFPKMDVDFFHTGHYECITCTKNKKPMVVSFEGLSGTTYNNDRYVLAYRLHQLFPYAKVLVTVRDKEGYIRSLYSQYVRGGGTQSLQEWRRFLYQHPYFLNWTLYVYQLMRLWGKEQVLVLHQCDMKKDPQNYVKRIAEFVGVPMPKDIDCSPVNTGLSDQQCRWWRLMNKWFVSRWNPQGILPRWCNPGFMFQKVIQYTKQ